MSSAGTAIQPVYVSLLSDISPNPSSSQASQPPLGFFDQFMADAVANARVSDTHVSNAMGASSPAPNSSTGAAPNTIQVSFDTTPGPLYGRPIAPSGSTDIGQWAVLPDGSYFSAGDVSADGIATLTEPPAGWQSTPTGQALTSPAGSAEGTGAEAPSVPRGGQTTATMAAVTTADAPAATAAPPLASTVAGNAPNTIQVAFDTTPGPLYGRPIAPSGSTDIGQWTVLPDGSYFSASDVSADGVATLTAPPAGWQGMPTGETLAALMEIPAGNS